MARPPKPTALLELSGAFKHNPNRRREGEPQDERPLDGPPDSLPVEMHPLWWELMEMIPAGVVKFADKWTCDGCVRLRWRIIHERVPASDLTLYFSVLGKLGCSPGGRAQMSITVEKKKSKFAELAEESRASAAVQ